MKWHLKKMPTTTKHLLTKPDSRIIEEIKFQPAQIEEKGIKKNVSFTISIDEKNDKLFLNGKNNVMACNGAHKTAEEQKGTFFSPSNFFATQLKKCNYLLNLKILFTEFIRNNKHK